MAITIKKCNITYAFMILEVDMCKIFLLLIFVVSLKGVFKLCIGAADTLTPAQRLTDGQTLVSSGEKFELGFFSPQPSSNKRYLGIWYKKTPATVVWVANRNNSIAGSLGSVTLSSAGQVVLLNGTGSIIWSSNLSKPATNPVARLLDTGNFVVIDSESTVDSAVCLWQSFENPTDTVLPGMTVGRIRDRDIFLTSWKTADDPSPGNSIYRLDFLGLSQFVIETGSNRNYRTGPWNGVGFSGLAPLNLIPTWQYVIGFEGNVLYNLTWPPNSSVTLRSVVSASGSLLSYELREDRNEWQLVCTVPNQVCDPYGRCGVNGFCRTTEQPICECLSGFTPKVPQKWKLHDWSDGCVRNEPLGCEKGDGFLKLDGVNVPDLLDFWSDNSMNLKECEVKCLKNCSCTAYADKISSGGGSGCLLWFGDLVDVSTFNQEGNQQEIYIRVPTSALNRTLSPSSNGVGSKRMEMEIAVSVTLGILIFFLVSYCIIRRILRNMKGEDLFNFDFGVSSKATADKHTKVKTKRTAKVDLEIPLFGFASISATTNNFSDSNKLGEGGFGPVYRGRLLNGYEVAVKRLSRKSTQGHDELKNEALLIAKLQHRNLVKLLGCCIEGDENILIYEYLPNKSLDTFLFDPAKNGALDWTTRITIIEGIAQGLLYLHQYSRLKIIHRDLKASNILLDKDMCPKISDFGMARIFAGSKPGATNRIVGTYGYMAPEYALEGIFSVKSDVFSFGILLLEILSGKKNTQFYNTDSLNLLGYAWDLWTSGRALELKDRNLQDTSSAVYSLFIRYLHAALLCVQQHAIDRPTMAEVLSILSNENQNLPSPKLPAFSMHRSLVDPNSQKVEPRWSLNYVTASVVEAR